MTPPDANCTRCGGGGWVTVNLDIEHCPDCKKWLAAPPDAGPRPDAAPEDVVARLRNERFLGCTCILGGEGIHFGGCPTLAREEAAAKITRLRAEVAERNAWLAECYKQTGADDDGNEDWRLAPYAVQEVTRLRQEYDEAADKAFNDETAGRALMGRVMALESSLAEAQRERDEALREEDRLRDLLARVDDTTLDHAAEAQSWLAQCEQAREAFHRVLAQLTAAEARLAAREQEASVYRAVLEGAEYQQLDALPARGVEFARMLGQAAKARTIALTAPPDAPSDVRQGDSVVFHKSSPSEWTRTARVLSDGTFPCVMTSLGPAALTSLDELSREGQVIWRRPAAPGDETPPTAQEPA